MVGVVCEGIEMEEERGVMGGEGKFLGVGKGEVVD